jgi:plastocyanin
MTRTLATLAAVLGLALAGCGGDDESSSGSGGSEPSSGGGQQITLAAPEDGSLKFDKTELRAKAGTVTINFDNPSSVPHAVEIEGQKSETVTGAETSVTADLQPGEYEYFCPVGNHASQGMEGTLTVE